MKRLLTNELYTGDLKKVLSAFDFGPLRDASVLITGGLGLIGSAVADLLILYNKCCGAGIRLLIACRDKDRFFERYGGYPCVEYLRYDATEPISFDVDADYILHGAGAASPELYVSKPVETMLSNFDGIRNLLEYAGRHRTKRVLYISSSEVYGTKDTAAAFEEGRFGSVNINSVRASYAEAKRASEVLCKSYSSEYAVDTVIVRPGHIYGPTASPKDRRISSEFAYLAAEGKALKMKSPGLQKRSYCYAPDCAAAILIALLNGETGESYNIGHDEITSIREMARLLAEAGNVKLEVSEPTREEQERFNPMDNSSLNNRKIKAIGYRDTFSVREGLTHTVRILKELNGGG